MKRATCARVAGTAFLAYIVIGLVSLGLYGSASAGSTTAERLASLASHAATFKLVILLNFATGFVAITLAVALYGLTRDTGRDLALLGLSFRIIEGLMAAVGTVVSLALLALVSGRLATDAAGRNTLGTLMLASDPWFVTTSATAFAAGSTIFCYLLRRGRIIPQPLATLGLVASLLLLVLLPMQMIGALPSVVVTWMWVPMLLFEVPCGIWLIIASRRFVKMEQ